MFSILLLIVGSASDADDRLERLGRLLARVKMEKPARLVRGGPGSDSSWGAARVIQDDQDEDYGGVDNYEGDYEALKIPQMRSHTHTHTHTHPRRVITWAQGVNTKIWRHEQCEMLTHRTSTNLNACKALCASKARCTALNCNAGGSTTVCNQCQLLACTIPLPTPTWSVRGWMGHGAYRVRAECASPWKKDIRWSAKNHKFAWRADFGWCMRDTQGQPKTDHLKNGDICCTPDATLDCSSWECATRECEAIDGEIHYNDGPFACIVGGHGSHGGYYSGPAFETADD